MSATAVLFDLDGVIVDSRRAFAGSVNHALAANGLAERDPADLYPFIGPALHGTFRARVPLAVATSKPAALAEPLLEALGLREHFAVLAGPSLDAEAEGKTITLGRALAALHGGASPVMVGDRLYDVVAAHDHGLAAVGVLWGIGDEAELREAGADLIVRAPHELPAALGLS